VAVLLYYFRRPYGEKGEVPDWWFRAKYFKEKGYIPAWMAIKNVEESTSGGSGKPGTSSPSGKS
jgi:hypothetical protein